MTTSVWDLWSVMGPFARAIVALLIVMSVASLATAVERLLAVRAAASDLGRFERTWADILRATPSPEARREAFDRLVRRDVLATGAALRRGLVVLATVGSTAPFVGLTGTVLGIVNAFQHLASNEHGGIERVSSGIAEALVTTALGIGVAVPAVWLFNLLTSRIGQVLVALECRAQDVAITALRDPR